jgi:uroporphyrin-3 C-methyltransferase
MDLTVPEVPTPAAPAVPSTPAAGARHRALRWGAAAVVAALAIAALVVAWQAQERVRNLEQELVRRQQDSQTAATEARLLAKQAQEVAREAAAKLALVEARVAEVAVQRSQLEELMQSLSRSRDENVVVDIEAAIRVAQRQALITGSAEPLVAALKQADERLARYNQPRLDGVRRAIARDLDRVKAVAVADVASLTIKLDEAVRVVDELPLLATAEAAAKAGAAAPKGAASKPAAPPAREAPAWPVGWPESWSAFGERVWSEARSLIRVARIEHPEAMLVAPEQALFLRENLKLRLLNARLALLSRQFDTAQSDLQVAQATLERWFDRNARKVALVTELVKQVAAQARNVSLPRPDETLVALTAAAAGR